MWANLRPVRRWRPGTDRDQKRLTFADGKIIAQPVPVGQRLDVHIVKPGDRIGAFATFDLVAQGFGPGRCCRFRAGGGFGRRCRRRFSGLRPVDRTRGDRRHVDAARPAGRRCGQGASGKAGCGQGTGIDPARQGQNLVPAQRRGRVQRGVAGQFACRNAHARRYAGHRVPLPRHCDLIAGIGDDAARIRRWPVGGCLKDRVRRIEPALTQMAQIAVKQPVAFAGRQRQERNPHRRPTNEPSRNFDRHARFLTAMGPLTGPFCSLSRADGTA